MREPDVKNDIRGESVPKVVFYINILYSTDTRASLLNPLGVISSSGERWWSESASGLQKHGNLDV